MRQPENRLEFTDCFCRSGAEDSVLSDPGNGGIDGGYGIQLLLNMAYLISGRTDGQFIAGPGDRNAGNLLCCVDVNAFPVKIPEDLNGTVALLSKGTGAPLGQPDCRPVDGSGTDR